MKRNPKTGKLMKGFARVPKARRIEIARMGGIATFKKKGRKYMANLGRHGGLAMSVIEKPKTK